METNISEQQPVSKNIPKPNFNLQEFFNKNKKIILVVLAILLVLESLWAISFIKGTTKTTTSKTTTPEKPKQKIASITLDPANSETKVGQELTVKINVDTNNREVNGVDAVIKYDPQFLEVVDSENQTPSIQVQNGGLFDTLLINDVNPVEGTINITASRISPDQKPVSGKGTLALVTFIAKQEGATRLVTVFDYTKTNTSNVMEAKTSNNILTTVSDASVKINK